MLDLVSLLLRIMHLYLLAKQLNLVVTKLRFDKLLALADSILLIVIAL